MLDLTYIFCVYSILGWAAEFVFYFIKTGKPQRRGILHGAYCPLYGFSLAVCSALTAGLPTVAAIAVCALVCTAFEFICGVLFDKLLGRVMWDYRDRRFNLSGYVCAEFAALWGIAAALCIKLFNPLLLAQPAGFKLCVSIALCAAMIADLVSFVKIS